MVVLVEFVCVFCGAVRDAFGAWHDSGTRPETFGHGVCDLCFERHSATDEPRASEELP